MKFVVLGATGPTGVQLVEESLQQGHEVTALVRNPDKIEIKHDRLNVEKVDIFNENDLAAHMKESDAVFSCLGHHAVFWKPCTLYSTSIKTISKAMREAGVSRFLAITSWGTKHDAGLPWVCKYIFRPVFLKNCLNDMGAMEDYLSDSCQDLDFTVVRPAALTNDKSTDKEVLAVDGQYVPDASWKIPRRDVAKFMLKCVANGEWKKKHVSIGMK